MLFMFLKLPTKRLVQNILFTLSNYNFSHDWLFPAGFISVNRHTIDFLKKEKISDLIIFFFKSKVSF